MSTPDSPLAMPASWDSLAGESPADPPPLFTHFAHDALRLAEPTPTSRLLDIACGAGAVSLLAAPRVAHVDAVDFAPSIIDSLRRRAAEKGLANIAPRVADAQALPFEDAGHDIAIALFAFTFVPDRARAFRELTRVLAPGGRALVSGWAPMDTVPAFAAMFTAMNDEIPGLVGGPVRLPLSDPSDLRAEMKSAGLRDIEVHTLVHRGAADSPRSLWWSNAAASPLIALLRREMGDPDFEAFSAAVVARLTEKLGPGRVEWDSVAHLGVARK